MLEPEEAEKKPARRNADDVVRYQRDNELIIQPLNVKEPKTAGFGTVLNIIIGLIIGLAAMYFLVLPARVAQVTREAQASVREVADNLDSKTAEIQELNATITKLQNENNALEDVINGYTGEDGTLGNIDLLLDAASEYLTTKDVQVTAAKLETVADSVDFDNMSDSFRKLYDTLLAMVGPEMSSSLYTEGYAAYRNEDYNTAVELLERAVYYDVTNADALFNLGNAYRRLENYEKATEVFTLVTERFPGTERARRSKQYLDEIASMNQ
jgi:TolA-binding protein